MKQCSALFLATGSPLPRRHSWSLRDVSYSHICCLGRLLLTNVIRRFRIEIFLCRRYFAMCQSNSLDPL